MTDFKTPMQLAGGWHFTREIVCLYLKRLEISR